jgi:hypothetical protein
MSKIKIKQFGSIKSGNQKNDGDMKNLLNLLNFIG